MNEQKNLRSKLYDLRSDCEDVWGLVPKPVKNIGLASLFVLTYGFGEYRGIQRTDTPIIEEKNARISELMKQHSNFVQQLPNYDGTAAFFFGSPVENGKVITYEDWLIQDIKDNYRK